MRKEARQRLIAFCLGLPFAYEDYPFDNITDPGAWTVMRHSINRKSFAYIYERGGSLCVNLKADPLDADFLRHTFEAVSPGYHMNKTHWITVAVGGDVPWEQIEELIRRSYDLIKPKRTKAFSGVE